MVKFLTPLPAAVLLLTAAPATAADPATPAADRTPPAWHRSRPPLAPPSWSLEIKFGQFEPELEEWETFYGEEEADQTALGLAYKISRGWEVGLELAYLSENGDGRLPLNNALGGDVTFQLYPLHLYTVYRLVFSEDQLFVPYLGGGFTRTYYRQSIDNQPSRRGDSDGSHVRGGVQILLDRLDRSSAAAMETDHSVNNTYLVLEAQRLDVEVNGIELGGDSLYAGLLFEF